jgi:hypothetical protein
MSNLTAARIVELVKADDSVATLFHWLVVENYMPIANRYCWRMAAARKTSGAQIGCPSVRKCSSRH